MVIMTKIDFQFSLSSINGMAGLFLELDIRLQ